MKELDLLVEDRALAPWDGDTFQTGMIGRKRGTKQSSAGWGLRAMLWISR